MTHSTRLIVCRNSALADRERLRVAQASGELGTQVTTLLGLVQTAYRPPLPGSQAALNDQSAGEATPTTGPGANLLKRVGERPALLAALRERVKQVRLHAWAGGAPLRCSADPAGVAFSRTSAESGVFALAEGTWGTSNLERAIQAFIERCETRKCAAVNAESFRPGPNESLAWDSVEAVGWVNDIDRNDLRPRVAWEARLLTALGADFRPPGTTGQSTGETPVFDDTPLPTWVAPDTVAEAVAAVRRVAEMPKESRVRVLVPDQATALRVAAAGIRANEAFSVTEKSALSSHVLVDSLRSALPWFSGVSDPVLHAAAIQRVLCGPRITRALPKGVAENLAKALPDAKDSAAVDAIRSVRLSTRQFHRILVAARIGAAPLSAWRTRMANLAKTMPKPGERDVRREARILQLRLERLAACIAGSPLPIDLAPDDNDDAFTLASFEADAEEPPPGTLGALRRFILDAGVRASGDPVALAVLAALRSVANNPATPSEFAVAIGAVADAGVIVRGREVVTYDEADDAPCDLLVLMGLHDHGFAAVSAPDPFLSSTTLAQLGTPIGAEATLSRVNRLGQLCRAASFTFALLVRTDANGRAVRAPVQPRLAILGDVSCGGFGLSGTHGASALRSIEGVQSVPPDAGNAAARHLALQASIEWARTGRGRMPPAAKRKDPTATIADQLNDLEASSQGPLAPTWMGPWLGRVELDDNWAKDDKHQIKKWSVSGHFEALTTFPYRFFVSRVLGISEQDEIEEELDPSEIGEALHLTFENMAAKLVETLRPAEDGVKAARQELVEALRPGAETTLLAAEAELGDHDAALDSAFGGQRSRWNAHWGGSPLATYDFTYSRVRSSGTREKALLKWPESAVKEMPAFKDAKRALLDTLDPERPVDAKDKTWNDNVAEWLLSYVMSGGTMPPKGITHGKTAVGVGLETLKAFVTQPTAMALMAESATVVVNAKLAALAAAPSFAGKIVAILPELTFGEPPDDDDKVGEKERRQVACLTLGTRSLPVRGAVDRVLLAKSGEQYGIEILDYKSGKKHSENALRLAVATLARPQLPVYALVLGDLLAEGAIEPLPKDTPVCTLGYDYIRGKSSLIDGIPAGPNELARWRAAIATMVERAFAGKFDLVPIDAGSHSTAFGYSAGGVGLRDACRFETLPGAVVSADDDSDNTGAADTEPS